MIIPIGKISISQRQLTRLHTIVFPVGVYSVRVIDGTVVEVEATRELTQPEKDNLLQKIISLDDSPTTEELSAQEIEDIKKKANKDISLSDIVRVLRVRKII